MARLPKIEKVKVDIPENGGYFFRERIADGTDALGPMVKTYAKITVPPHTTMSYHQHVGDFEIYYILQGEGMYRDNDEEYPIKPGDVLRCADGDFHGIGNTGDQDLAFIALIVATS
ncbi:MAG: cupin domain-containing protein [Eggerthellaceae bacterium]|jgi:quercetin dioxygenase-like cupin family protein